MNTIFIIACIIAFLFACYMTEIEEEDVFFASPTVFLAIFMIASFYMYKKEFLEIFHNIDYLSSSLFLVGWFVIGIIWSLFRWTRYVRYRYKKFLKDKEDYPSTVKDSNSYKPKVSTNKQRLSTWIVYWPFSAVNYVSGLMLYDLTTYIVSKMTVVYNKITDNQFKS
jgi:predicted membrane protein